MLPLPPLLHDLTAPLSNPPPTNTFSQVYMYLFLFLGDEHNFSSSRKVIFSSFRFSLSLFLWAIPRPDHSPHLLLDDIPRSVLLCRNRWLLPLTAATALHTIRAARHGVFHSISSFFRFVLVRISYSVVYFFPFSTNFYFSSLFFADYYVVFVAPAAGWCWWYCCCRRRRRHRIEGDDDFLSIYILWEGKCV